MIRRMTLHTGPIDSMTDQNEPRLETRNGPLVVLFILWSISVYLLFHASPQGFLSQLASTFEDVRATDSVFVVLSPILALVLNGIVSSDNKARLVFWRWKDALPGHRAFSILAPTDARISIPVLKSRVSPWPKTPREENVAWYRLYKQYSSKPTIVQSQKSFLLARDLATISFLFALIGPWGLLITQGNWYWAPLYAVVMLAHYLILSVVAQNHGRRFVCNVMAECVTDI